MIRAAVFYDDAGKIVSCKTGSETGINLTAESSVFNYIFFEDVPDVDFKYVEDGQLVDMPIMPSAFHEFNYSTKTWDFDLARAQKGKWKEIKKARDVHEFGEFEWGGYTFQCDEVSQRRIQGAVQLAAIDPEMTLDWTLADNSVATFTADEYVQIGQTLAVHVSDCHERGRMLRQQINEATNQEQLEAIVW